MWGWWPMDYLMIARLTNDRNNNPLSQVHQKSFPIHNKFERHAIYQHDCLQAKGRNQSDRNATWRIYFRLTEQQQRSVVVVVFTCQPSRWWRHASNYDDDRYPSIRFHRFRFRKASRQIGNEWSVTNKEDNSLENPISSTNLDIDWRCVFWRQVDTPPDFR